MRKRRQEQDAAYNLYNKLTNSPTVSTLFNRREEAAAAYRILRKLGITGERDGNTTDTRADEQATRHARGNPSIMEGEQPARAASAHLPAESELFSRPSKENDEQLLVLFTEAVIKQAELVHACLEYWHTNNLRSLREADEGKRVTETGITVREQKRTERTAKREQTEAVMRTKLASVIERQASLRLLEMVMPNGKPLSQCTGDYCRELGPAMGDWLTAIGARAGAGLVGAAVSEDEARKLYDTAAKR